MQRDPLTLSAEIANELANLAPSPWRAAEIEARLESPTVINTIVRYEFADGRKESHWDVGGLPRRLVDLAQLVSTTEKGLFRECRFQLRSDGEYRVDFSY